MTHFPRCHRGFTLIEMLVVIAISVIVLSVITLNAPALQQQQKRLRRPVEMGRILLACRHFLRDNLRLPDLSVPEDQALWVRYYRPSASLRSTPEQLLPDGFEYQLLQPYQPPGLTTDALPGKVRVRGTACDGSASEPEAFCEYTVPFY